MATFFPRPALTDPYAPTHEAEDKEERVRRRHTFYSNRFATYPIEHLQLLCHDVGIDFSTMSYSQMVQALATLESQKP